MVKTLEKPAFSPSLESIITNSLTPKAAISYLRVSTHDQAERGGGADEGFSIPAQREANKKKAASIGAIVIKEFVDRGASARSADRPELQRMLEYIEENKNNVDYVIVHKVDRLARNRGDDIDISRALQKSGVKLVSTTESIDETPSGILLHGIMSSIAEFYSRNLSNEVLKGMGQKVKSGGTNYKAPIGYKNIRTIDDKGRENRTVILDEERAPLISLAFEYYATGDWTMQSLADHLASRGLATAATPKLPSRLVDKKLLNKILISPYYKGLVSFQGALHKGCHIPITDEKTWEQVQSVIASHINGERTRTHPHYLKSSVFCGQCQSRLLVHMAKSSHGTIYPYLVCAGRHCKRNTCKQKAVMIEEVEYHIEKLYEKISLTPGLRQRLESWMLEYIKESTDKFNDEKTLLIKEKEKLERQQVKLLQAHYDDAIPMDLFKSEQERLSKSILNIVDNIESHETHYEVIQSNLKQALDLMEDCGRAYKQAPESIKRAFNQAIFEKILVHPDCSVSPEFAAPFDILLDITNAIHQYDNKLPSTDDNKVNSGSSKQTKNPMQVFFAQGSNKVILVVLRIKHTPRMHSTDNAG